MAPKSASTFLQRLPLLRGELHPVYSAFARKARRCAEEHPRHGIVSEAVMVNYVFIAAAKTNHPLSNHGEYGVLCVVGIAMVYETLAETSYAYDPQAVFCSPQQGNPPVRGYFSGVELPCYLSGPMEPGIVWGDSGNSYSPRLRQVRLFSTLAKKV